VHYYKVIIHGHSLPPKEENIGEDTAKRVPLDKRVYFIPDILTSEIMWVAVTTLILVVLVTWFFHAPLENHADPQATPLGTTAPWYFLWIQGALKLGDKVLWGIIFPTVFLVFLIVWPYIDTAPSRRWAHRRIQLTVGFLIMSVMVIFSYMGLPEFGVVNSADTTVMYHLTKEPAHNQVGTLRPIPFDQLQPGVYTTRQFEAEDASEYTAVVNAFGQELALVPYEGGTPLADEVMAYLQTQHLTLTSLDVTTVPSTSSELYEVVDEFAHELEVFEAELHNAVGFVIITDAQDDLKRIDVVIRWEDVELENGKVVYDENGEPTLRLDEAGNPIPRINGQHIYIHRDSQYFSAPGA